MANRQSSDRLSSLAGKIMGLDDPFDDDNLGVLFHAAHEENGDIAFRNAADDLFGNWVRSARSLAGSVLSQDETKGPNAGTSAYELIAAVETQNVETTEMLIYMVAATVLAKLIEEEGGGRTNISFSPLDMDAMNRMYDMDASRDRMITTIKITPRKTLAASLLDQADDTPAAPQVVSSGEREPYTFFKSGSGRVGPISDDEAQTMVYASVDPTAHIEHRRCPYTGCPSPSDVSSCAFPACPEITSEAIDSTDAQA